MHFRFPHIKPYVIGTLANHTGPVEVLSYPIPAEGDGLDIILSRATIMVRLEPGQPGTLKEVPLTDLTVHPLPEEG